MRFRVLAAVCILTLFQCVDNKDYNLDSLSLTPVIAFPLAFGELTVLDLISDKDSAYLKVYPDGLLYFSYYQTMASQDIRGLFKLPDNTTNTSFDIPAGVYPPIPADILLATVSKTVDLGLNPELLTETLLKSGSLDYAVTITPSNINLPFQINATLIDVVDKTTQAPLTFTASTGTGSQSLQNYVLKMDNNRFAIRLDLILKKRSTATLLNTNPKVNVNLTFKGLDFTYIKGFLGDQTVNLPPQSLDLSAFGSSLNKAKISFVQPVLTLTVRSDYGVPCQVIFNKLEANKTGAALAIQTSPASPINLNFPSTLGTSATTAVSITNATAVMNFSPTQLSYSASARINKGLSTGVDFLADTSKLKVSMTAEVPLYGQVSGITMIDTVAIDFGDANESSVYSAALKIKAVNEMPLDAYVQLYLAGKTYNIFDSVFTANQKYVVKASSVTGTGDLQTAGTANLNLDLSSDRISRLFSASYLIIKSKMNTTKDASGALLNVKFKAAYKLKLNVGLLARVNISAKTPK